MQHICGNFDTSTKFPYAGEKIGESHIASNDQDLMYFTLRISYYENNLIRLFSQFEVSLFILVSG